MRFMRTESVLQTKNRSGPAKNRFSVALEVTPVPTQTTLFRYLPKEHNLSIHKSHLLRVVRPVILCDWCFYAGRINEQEQKYRSNFGEVDVAPAKN